MKRPDRSRGGGPTWRRRRRDNEESERLCRGCLA